MDFNKKMEIMEKISNTQFRITMAIAQNEVIMDRDRDLLLLAMSLRMADDNDELDKYVDTMINEENIRLYQFMQQKSYEEYGRHVDLIPFDDYAKFYSEMAFVHDHGIFDDLYRLWSPRQVTSTKATDHRNGMTFVDTLCLMKMNNIENDNSSNSRFTGGFGDFHFERGKPFNNGNQRMAGENRNGRTYPGSSFYNFNPYGSFR